MARLRKIGGTAGAAGMLLLLVVACGEAAPAALALGQEALVEHADVGTETGAPTSLAVTVLAVREGTMEELGSFYEIDPEDQDKTPAGPPAESGQLPAERPGPGDGLGVLGGLLIGGRGAPASPAPGRPRWRVSPDRADPLIH